MAWRYTHFESLECGEGVAARCIRAVYGLIAGGKRGDIRAGDDLLIGGNVANQLSTWTSTTFGTTFGAGLYSRPTDNDAALLALLLLQHIVLHGRVGQFQVARGEILTHLCQAVGIRCAASGRQQRQCP